MSNNNTPGFLTRLQVSLPTYVDESSEPIIVTMDCLSKSFTPEIEALDNSSDSSAGWKSTSPVKGTRGFTVEAAFNDAQFYKKLVEAWYSDDCGTHILEVTMSQTLCGDDDFEAPLWTIVGSAAMTALPATMDGPAALAAFSLSLSSSGKPTVTIGEDGDGGLGEL